MAFTENIDLADSYDLTQPDTTFLHEMGHFFGFGFHSNTKTCLEPMPDIMNCPALEYGDMYDVMGSSGRYSSSLNSVLRYRLGWLAAADLQIVNETSRVTI